jgi:hypothetical protein
MSSREALISALAAVAFGAAATSTPADARTDPARVSDEIASASNPDALRRHLGDPDWGAPAVGRLLELQGFTRLAQAGDPNLQLCLYRPDDPRYRTDPRCPPLAMPTTTGSGSGSSSSSSSTPPPNNGYPG